MFSNGVLFSVDVSIQYLTCKICYVRFPDYLSIVEPCTHNNEQFGGWIIKMKHILSILQGF